MPRTPLTICVTRRSTTTLASASASRRSSPCSRPMSSSMASIAIAAASSRSSSNPNVSHASGVHAIGAVEPEVVAHRERQPRTLDGRLDRELRDLAVSLGRVPVARRDERAVDRDREEERRPRDELLAVDVPAARCAAARSSGLPARPAASRSRRGTGAARPRRPRSVATDARRPRRAPRAASTVSPSATPSRSLSGVLPAAGVA